MKELYPIIDAEFMSSKIIQDDLPIKSFNGDPKFRIYISGLILNTTPFTPGLTSTYDANSQGTGTIAIDNIIVNNDPDNSNDFTIIIGRLITVTLKETIGTQQIEKHSKTLHLRW